MNNSIANFTTPAASTNSTTNGVWMITNSEMIVFSINVVFGLPVHSYIVWLIVTGEEIASHFFHLNLSVCEIIYALTSLLFALSKDFPSVLSVGHFFVGLGLNGRPLFQCLICFERYLAVVHPVTFLKYKPLRYRAICCAAVWICSLGTCCFYRFFLELQTFYKYVWLLSFQFLVFLSVQLFCCVSVLRALKQSGPGERGREREEENHIKRRAFYFILITTVTMIIMFVPFIFTGILVFLQQDASVLYFISVCCFIVSAFVHPVLYLQRNKKFSCLCVP